MRATRCRTPGQHQHYWVGAGDAWLLARTPRWVPEGECEALMMQVVVIVGWCGWVCGGCVWGDAVQWGWGGRTPLCLLRRWQWHPAGGYVHHRSSRNPINQPTTTTTATVNSACRETSTGQVQPHPKQQPPPPPPRKLLISKNPKRRTLDCGPHTWQTVQFLVTEMAGLGIPHRHQVLAYQREQRDQVGLVLELRPCHRGNQPGARSQKKRRKASERNASTPRRRMGLPRNKE